MTSKSTDRKKAGRPTTRLQGVEYVKVHMTLPEPLVDKLNECYYASSHKSKGSLLTEFLDKALTEAGYKPNLPTR